MDYRVETGFGVPLHRLEQPERRTDVHYMTVRAQSLHRPFPEQYDVRVDEAGYIAVMWGGGYRLDMIFFSMQDARAIVQAARKGLTELDLTPFISDGDMHYMTVWAQAVNRVLPEQYYIRVNAFGGIQIIRGGAGEYILS